MNIERTYDHQLIAKLNKPVQDLHCKLYPNLFKTYNEGEIAEAFESIIARDNHLFYIIKDGDRSVGYIWAEIKTYAESAFKNSYQTIFVNHLCVVETDRNKGYGSKLMDRIYQLAEENEIDRIELDFWAGNERMDAFCNKHGMKKQREFLYKPV